MAQKETAYTETCLYCLWYDGEYTKHITMDMRVAYKILIGIQCLNAGLWRPMCWEQLRPVVYQGGGGLGCSNPLQNSEGPPKSCQTQLDL